MTQNIGTRIAAPIIQDDSTDTFPTHYPNRGFGGVRTNYADRAALDGILAAQREQFMLLLTNDGRVYQLQPDLVTWLDVTTIQAATLAANGGASLVGTSTGQTTEARFVADEIVIAAAAPRTLLASNGGAALIGSSTGATVEVRIAVAEGAITALQATQMSGLAAFDTVAHMNANLNYPAQSGAIITNDPTPANNQNIYIKSGASGSGSWVLSGTNQVAAEAAARIAGDLLNGANLAVTQMSFVANIGPLPLSGFDDYVADLDGVVWMGLRPDGTIFAPPQSGLGSVPAALVTLSNLVAAFVPAGPLPLSGFDYYIADLNGVTSYGIRADLSVFDANAISAITTPTDPLVYTKTISGHAQIFAANLSGETELSFIAADCFGPQIINVSALVRAVRYSTNRNGAVKTWRSDVFGNRAVSEGGLIEMWLLDWQSLSQGAYATTLLNPTSKYPATARMFNNGLRTGLAPGSVGAINPALMTSFVGLAEAVSGIYGETGAAAAANWITNDCSLNVGLLPQLLFAAHGVGGQSYAGISQGTVPYANGVAQVTAAVSIAAGLGLGLYVGYVVWVGGEADHISNTSRSAFLADLIAGQANFTTDYSALTGQSDQVVALIPQMASWTSNSFVGNRATTTSVIPLAQLDAQETSANIAIPVPEYIFAHYPSDGVHLAGAAEYDRMLEYCAKARQWISNGRKWKGLPPLHITRVGAVITLQLDLSGGAVGPVQIGTYFCTDPGSSGFRYGNDGGPVSMTSVVATAIDTITITLSANPGSPTGEYLGYADIGTIGANGGPTTGPRGLVYDSSPAISLVDGSHLYQPLVIFTKPIPY